MSYEIESGAETVLQGVIAEYVEDLDEDTRLEAALTAGEVFSHFYDVEDPDEAVQRAYDNIDELDASDFRSMDVPDEKVPELREDMRDVAEDAVNGDIPSTWVYGEEF